jgi:uncharacterized protein YndB with AHSA1/START domain
MPDIVHELQIEASPQRIFDVINSAAGERGFWTDQTEYEPRVGSVAMFGFGPDAETKFHFHVDAMDAPRTLDWTCVDGPPEWKGTRIRWLLEPADGDATRVRFEHLDWGSADGALASCNFTWARILQRLDALVTKGESNPVFAGGAYG